MERAGEAFSPMELWARVARPRESTDDDPVFQHLFMIASIFEFIQGIFRGRRRTSPLFSQFPQAGRGIPHGKREMFGVMVKVPPILGHDGVCAHEFGVGGDGGILGFQHGPVLLAERVRHDESLIHRSEGVNEGKKLFRLLRSEFAGDFINQRANHPDLMLRHVIEKKIDERDGIREPDVPERKKEFVRIENQAQWLSPTARP